MSLKPDEIITLIEQQRYSEAESEIVNILQFIAQEGGKVAIVVDEKDQHATPEQIEQAQYGYLLKMTVAISDLFSVPEYKPTINAINTFTSCKPSLDWIFDTSLWGNTDILIEQLGIISQATDGTLSIDENRLPHLLMLVSSGSKFQLPWAQLMELLPTESITAYFGLLNHPFPALTPETDAGFNFLLEVASTLPMVNLSDINTIKRLVYPYFVCSYATSERKYEFKKWLNRLLKYNIDKSQPKPLKKSLKIASKRYLSDKKRHKLVVLLETYPGHSAMFRCYNKHMIELTKHFDVVAFIGESEQKKANLDCFERVITINESNSVHKHAQLVLNEKPDIIYYPSLGMRFWTIPLALLRLAPVQLMTGGHPASSYSDNMDYLLGPVDSFEPEEVQPYLTEEYIMLRNVNNNMMFNTKPPAITDDFISQHNHFLERDDNIIIGINGVLTKVTYEVIQMCHEIEQRSQKSVTFIFFSLSQRRDIGYLATKNQLSRFIKSFELVGFSDYLTYLKTIASCDFLLPTFPFGGSNSNIDAMFLNKPKLFLRGHKEIYTKTDLCEWHRVGLDDLLGFDTVEELTEVAIKLTEDKELRRAYRQKMIDSNCLEKTFDIKLVDGEDIIVQLVKEAISRTKKKQISNKFNLSKV